MAWLAQHARDGGAPKNGPYACLTQAQMITDGRLRPGRGVDQSVEQPDDLGRWRLQGIECLRPLGAQPLSHLLPRPAVSAAAALHAPPRPTLITARLSVTSAYP